MVPEMYLLSERTFPVNRLPSLATAVNLLPTRVQVPCQEPPAAMKV